MEPQLKEKFVKALRSNRYNKTTMKFRFKWVTDPKPSYCASGILFNVISRFGWTKEFCVHGDKGKQWHHRINAYLENNYWGTRQRQLNDYGFTYEEYSKLIHWNDALDLSFPEIADRVEAEF